MRLGPGFAISQPKSFLAKDVKADLKKLFVALGKGAVSAAFQDWKGAAAQAVEAVAALGLKDTPGEVAWKLIQGSLATAMVELVREQAHLINPEQAKAKVEDLLARLDLALSCQDITIDDEFLKRPGQLLLLQDLKPPLADFLLALGLDEPQARAVAHRLPAYFVFALHEACREKPEAFEKLKKEAGAGFSEAARQEMAWLNYYAWLQRQTREPLFGETFSLEDVYINLRAYIEEPDQKNRGSVLGHGEKKVKETVVDLEAELEAWLTGADQTDGLRVISGGPGSGKSAFAKRFAARQAAQGSRRVLLIPLHFLDPTKKLIPAVGEFLKNDLYLSRIENPLAGRELDQGLLLIFDGLDELSAQGKMGQKVVRDFTEEVRRQVEMANHQSARLFVLLSGRNLAVQEAEEVVRQPERTLHLLPYHVTEGERKGYVDEGRKLEVDQRQEWWSKYGRITVRGYTGLPPELNWGRLAEVTAQPLLNYLVALSLARGLKVGVKANINSVYAYLLDSVHERAYAGKRPHPGEKPLSKEEYDLILETIALAMWHNYSRIATVAEIEECCKMVRLQVFLDKLKADEGGGVTRLLTAFYFRRSGHTLQGQETFEFTHKSFGEYLTARRIVRTVADIQEQMALLRPGRAGGWDEVEALTHWTEVCGRGALDGYLLEFLRDEIALSVKRGQGLVSTWQAALVRLFSHVLVNGSPMERLTHRPSFFLERVWSANAEETLLAAINACAIATGQRAKIGANLRYIDSFLRYIQSIKGFSSTTSDCLNALDLTGAPLMASFLFGVNLNKANLPRSNLFGANCIWCFFKEANLSESNLVEANLTHATLELCNLEGANLKGANLFEANLTGARLAGANLQGANLTGAKLDGVMVGDLVLSGSDLRAALEAGVPLEPEPMKAFLDRRRAQGKGKAKSK